MFLRPERQTFQAHVSGPDPLASLLPAPVGIRSFGKVLRKYAKVVPAERQCSVVTQFGNGGQLDHQMANDSPHRDVSLLLCDSFSFQHIHLNELGFF